MSDLDAALTRRMAKLGLREEDIVENFIRGSGAGGQKINKTSSTVQLRHEPSGIELRCQRERSQSANRYWARVELCQQLEAKKRQEREEKKAASEKERRRTRPRPRGVKEQLLQGKHKRSETKAMRGKVRDRE